MTQIHCTVTLVDPLAQDVPEVREAVTVVVPTAAKVANPGVVDENVTTDELPDVHAAELVTSTLFCVAVNCVLEVFARVKVWLAGVMIRDWVPVTVTVAVALTPATLAVIVTLEAGPTPVTTPALTVAQGLELTQLALLVTSLVPLLYVAVAARLPVAPWAKDNVLGVTAREFGWFTKKPEHPLPMASRKATINAAIRDSFWSEFPIIEAKASKTVLSEGP